MRLQRFVIMLNIVITTMSKSKTIDFLFEDPSLPHQKYALVSIVGPLMPQKCDTWGLKIRGTAETLDQAKALTQRLMKIDNDYDIYTVEVGKFFPLAVEPHDIGNVEYENNQLNELIKSYLENREAANEQWMKRKNEMIKEAVREGKNQAELVGKPEHPIAVLQRLKQYEIDIGDIREQMDSLQENLQLARDKFATYTEEERKIAESELNNAIDNAKETITSDAQATSVEDLRKQLLEDLNVDSSKTERTSVSINKTVEEVKKCEDEISELNLLKASVDAETSPALFAKVSKQIQDARDNLVELKNKLSNSQAVNEFINSNYTSGKYDYLNSVSAPL